jgi:hypothetical protein
VQKPFLKESSGTGIVTMAKKPATAKAAGTVPETVLKKRKREEEWAAKKAAAATEAKKKAREQRREVFKRAETYVKEYRSQVMIAKSIDYHFGGKVYMGSHLHIKVSLYSYDFIVLCIVMLIYHLVHFFKCLAITSCRTIAGNVLQSSHLRCWTGTSTWRLKCGALPFPFGAFVTLYMSCHAGKGSDQVEAGGKGQGWLLCGA